MKSSSAKEHLYKIGDGISEMSNPEVAQNIYDTYKFVMSLLDPEGFGHAVTAEVRDGARVCLGLEPVEMELIRVAREARKQNAE